MPIKRKCRILLQSRYQQHVSLSYRGFHVRAVSTVVESVKSQFSSSCIPSFSFPSQFLCHSSNRNFATSSARKMRFVQFAGTIGGPQRLGAQLSQDGDIIDISGVDSSIPNGLVNFLRSGTGMLDKAKRIVAEGKSVIPLSDVHLLPPVTSPDKVVCVGLNYRSHCEEQNRPLPQEPVFFSKWSSCIVGPNAEIKHPSVSNEFDWEVELAVIIGKLTRDVRPSSAMDHIFGFTVAQDLTARDWQKNRNGGQWLLGKSMDSSCPLGPSVVLKEVVANPHALPIHCTINGSLKQDGNTSDMIHKIDYIVSFLSHCCTLLPGDVILTGTPAGVGVFRNPQEFLKPGDIIESEIEGIGKLKNIIT